MILVDASAWIDHFRGVDPALAVLLEDGRAAVHELVLGELRMGRIPDRVVTLRRLAQLPRVPTAEHGDVEALVERHRLHGTGLGWVDAHLLAAARLADVPLYTRDRALAVAARRLGIPGA